MNPACDNCKSPALETQIPSAQISNVATELHDNQNNFFPIEPTGLDSTNVNNSSLDFNIMNHPSLEPNRLSHTTTMETSLQLTTNTAATNSLELTSQNPATVNSSDWCLQILSKEHPQKRLQILFLKIY